MHRLGTRCCRAFFRPRRRCTGLARTRLALDQTVTFVKAECIACSVFPALKEYRIVHAFHRSFGGLHTASQIALSHVGHASARSPQAAFYAPLPVIPHQRGIFLEVIDETIVRFVFDASDSIDKNTKPHRVDLKFDACPFRARICRATSPTASSASIIATYLLAQWRRCRGWY